MYDGIQYTGLGDRQFYKPYGLEGGLEGAGGSYYIYRLDGKNERLPSKCTDILLNKGDIVSVRTPGSGGYGNPRERDVGKVLTDVIEGKVTKEAAENLYGVAIVERNYKLAVDTEKTEEIRNK